MREAGSDGNRGTRQDHQNYRVVKISLNTKKSPEDLRRLALTQTLIKDYQLMFV